MRRLLRIGTVATVIGAMAMVAPTAAFAKGGGRGSTSPRLAFFNCTTGFPSGLNSFLGAQPPTSCDPTQPGSVAWVKGADSDGDHYALRLVTAPFTDYPTSYAGVSILNTTVNGESFPGVQQLSMAWNLSSSTIAQDLFLTLNDGSLVATTPQLCDTSEQASGGSTWVTSDFRNGPADTPCQLTLLIPQGGEFAAHSFQNGSWQYGYGGTDLGSSMNAWDWMDGYFANTGVSAPAITGAYLLQIDSNEALTGYVDNLTFDNTVFTAPPGQTKKS